MKRIILIAMTLILLLALPALAETFEEQCTAAGIELTFEDLNADLYTFTSTDPSVDVVTHASGRAKYVDEIDGPCIKTSADLAVRSQTKVKTYYWTPDEENGVDTLEAAAKLEDAKYMLYPFPNDGQKYTIDLNESAVGTNTICTVDEEAFPTAAVFGMKYVEEEDGSVYTSAAITAETATYRNIMAGSPILIVYYEYNPHTEKKIGIGARNAGARVACVMDEDKSTLAFEDSEDKISVADYLKMSDEEKEGLVIRYLSLKAKVMELYSIG